MPGPEIVELPRASGSSGAVPPLEVLDSVREVVDRVVRTGEVFLRVSPGPRPDLHAGVRDAESGYPLPGLPAYPVVAEPWWPAGAATWVARQLVQHSYLTSEASTAWLLTGRVVGRGSDAEPLVADPVPLALVGPGAFLEAESVYAAWRCRDYR